MADTLRALFESARRSAAAPRIRIALLLVLMVALGLVGLWPAPPRYHLWLNDQEVASAREATALEAALSNWAAEAMARTVTLEYQGQAWSYRLEELGLLLPLDRARAELRRSAGRQAWWQRSIAIRLDLAAGWDAIRLEAALAPVREAVERSPVPASLAADGVAVTVLPSADGVAVETEAVRRALAGLGGATRLALPVATVRPEMTTESVQQLGIKRVIAHWSTHYDPAIPRAENVERAARAFDGLILKPGEILSYNATVGPIDESTGWKEASVIVAGELVPGIGGGVCQVATTFYGAALRANLEVLERHPHQLAVSYISPSEDAAVAQGYQDLKIRNTTQGHLLVRTEAGGGTVTFRLYGDLPVGQEVRIESRVIGSQPFSTRVVEDPSLAPGQQVAVSGGTRGLTSEAYRVVRANGQVVKRELLSRDRYLPTPALVRTGRPSRPAVGGATPGGGS